MDRRDFIRLTAVSTVAGVVVPSVALAQESSTANMAGGVFYTQEHPGRWKQKVGGHLPIIEVSELKDKTSVKITTAHEMNAYEHYIIKHVLLDQNFNFIAEHLFNPTEDKMAVSSFDIGSYKGTLYVLSVCNKHDTWLNSTEI